MEKDDKDQRPPVVADRNPREETARKEQAETSADDTPPRYTDWASI